MQTRRTFTSALSGGSISGALHASPILDSAENRRYLNLTDFASVDRNGDVDTSKQIQAALSEGLPLFLPPGVYKLDSPIMVPNGARLSGAGDKFSTLRPSIVPSSALDIDDEGLVFGSRSPALFFLSGGRSTYVSDLNIQPAGDFAFNASLIEFGNNVRSVSLARIRLANASHAIRSLGHFWMSDLSQVHILNCDYALDLSNEGFKTSLKFANIYCENCGHAYILRNTQYSTLISCAADHIARPMQNPFRDEGNPYGVSFGKIDAINGIYDFYNAKGVSLFSCGTENSWGNGAVRMRASECSIIGLRIYNLQSAFVDPDLGDRASWGAIRFEPEVGHLTLMALSIEGLRNHALTAANQAIVSFNYDEKTYGTKSSKMVILQGFAVPSEMAVFLGAGNLERYCQAY